MSNRIKRIRRLAALVMLATALSPVASSEDESLPTYRVANLLNVDLENAKSYAKQLSVEIGGKLNEKRSEPAYQELGHACETAHKLPRCEEVSASVETASDRKEVRVSIEEYLPQRRSGELVMLTCSLSEANVECYKSLVPRMAQAVEKHDQKCHRGTECITSNEHFVPRSSRP